MNATDAIRILVAEKNPAARQIISKILADNGYERVAFTSSADQVLTALEHEAADFYLLDWPIAAANSMDLLETALQHRKLFRQPKMLMGASVPMTAIEQALKLGVRDYINKPFTPYLFMVKVEKALFGGYHDKPLRDIERRPTPQASPKEHPEAPYPAADGPRAGAGPFPPGRRVAGQQARAMDHFSKASEFLTLRRYDRAIAEFARAIRLRLLFPEAYRGIAEAFRGQGNLERTSQFMNKAAETHVWLDQHERAREVYDYVRKATPDAPNPYKVVGDHLRGQNDPAEQVRHYRRAAELSPGDVSVGVALARALVDADEREEAARVLAPIVDRQEVPPEMRGLFLQLRPPDPQAAPRRRGPGMRFLDMAGGGDGVEKRRTGRIPLADYAARLPHVEDTFQVVDISLVGIGFKATNATFAVGQEIAFDLVSMGETKVKKLTAVVKRVSPRVVGCEFANDVEAVRAKLKSGLPALAEAE